MRLYEFAIVNEGLLDKLPSWAKKAAISAIMAVTGTAAHGKDIVIEPHQVDAVIESMVRQGVDRNLAKSMIGNVIKVRKKEAEAPAKSYDFKPQDFHPKVDSPPEETKNVEADFQRELAAAQKEYNKKYVKPGGSAGNLAAGFGGNEVSKYNDSLVSAHNKEAWETTIGFVLQRYGKTGRNPHDNDNSSDVKIDVKSDADKLFDGRPEVEVEIDNGIIKTRAGDKIRLKSADKMGSSDSLGQNYEFRFHDGSKKIVWVKKSDRNFNYYTISK